MSDAHTDPDIQGFFGELYRLSDKHHRRVCCRLPRDLFLLMEAGAMQLYPGELSHGLGVLWVGSLVKLYEGHSGAVPYAWPDGDEGLGVAVFADGSA